jgi:hypothetical protein
MNEQSIQQHQNHPLAFQEAANIFNKCYMILFNEGADNSQEVLITSLAKSFAHEIILQIIAQYNFNTDSEKIFYYFEVDKSLEFL